jgi:hypothetical protein
MKLRNYFQISWKTPYWSEEDQIIHRRKQQLLKGLEDCESRLESIEICNSNGKPKDSLLLSQFLLVDICNVILRFYNQKEISNSGEVLKSLDKIPNAEIVATMENKISQISWDQDSEENALQIETLLSDLVYFCRKNLFIKHKSELESPIDIHKNRLRLQAFVLSFLVLLGIGKGIFEYTKRLPLKPDTLAISFSTQKDVVPDSSIAKEFPIRTDGQWNLIETESIENLHLFKIVPCHQNKARIQIRNLKIYDKDQKILFEKSLSYDEKEILELSKSIHSDNLIPGNLKPGFPLEMESTSSSPALYFHLDSPLKSKKISFEIRLKNKVEKYTEL